MRSRRLGGPLDSDLQAFPSHPSPSFPLCLHQLCPSAKKAHLVLHLCQGRKDESQRETLPLSFKKYLQSPTVLAVSRLPLHFVHEDSITVAPLLLMGKRKEKTLQNLHLVPGWLPAPQKAAEPCAHFKIRLMLESTGMAYGLFLKCSVLHGISFFALVDMFPMLMLPIRICSLMKHHP